MTNDDGDGAWIRTIRRVFLAGKITDNDWRRELVFGELAVRPGWPEWTRRGEGCVFGALCCTPAVDLFPVQSKAILSMLDYVGPYYVAPSYMSCGCTRHNHGALVGEETRLLAEAHMRAIKHCDLMSVWLDDASAAFTLCELGCALALRKDVFLNTPRYLPELGLIHGIFSDFDPQRPFYAATAAEAFVRDLAGRLSQCIKPATIDPAALSPIEGRFLQAWNTLNCYSRTPHGGYHGRDGKYLALFPQYPLDGGRYRLDFAYVDPALYGGDVAGYEHLSGLRIAIELDGREGHSSTEDIARDRKRQRAIEAMGWRVIRFGGKEVYHDAPACAAEARAIIARALDERAACPHAVVVEPPAPRLLAAPVAPVEVVAPAPPDDGRETPVAEWMREEEEKLAGVLLLHRPLERRTREELVDFTPRTRELAPLFTALVKGRDLPPSMADLAKRLVDEAAQRPAISLKELRWLMFEVWHPVAEVLGDYGVALQQVADDPGVLIGCCPFCGTEALGVCPQDHAWSCGSCGRGGNAYSFIGEYREMELARALGDADG